MKGFRLSETSKRTAVLHRKSDHPNSIKGGKAGGSIVRMCLRGRAREGHYSMLSCHVRSVKKEGEELKKK